MAKKALRGRKPKLKKKLKKLFLNAVRRYGDEVVVGLLVGVAAQFLADAGEARVQRRRKIAEAA